MIVTNPTDAVRDSTTVPAGKALAAEFPIPASFVYSLVSWATFPSSSRISVSEIHGICPPHHSGWYRLGVCPLSRRAQLVKGRQVQSLGGTARRLLTDRGVML